MKSNCGDSCDGDVEFTLKFDWNNVDPTDSMARYDTSKNKYFKMKLDFPVGYGGIPDLKDMLQSRGDKDRNSTDINNYKDSKDPAITGYKGEISLGKIKCCGGNLSGDAQLTANYGAKDLFLYTINYKIIVIECGKLDTGTSVSMKFHEKGPKNRKLVKTGGVSVL